MLPVRLKEVDAKLASSGACWKTERRIDKNSKDVLVDSYILDISVDRELKPVSHLLEMD